MRVIAGRLRGRRLHAVRGEGVRPTSARARTGLFDWLGGEVAGVSILDLFAGTGALGIEALSRGAAHVTFVERDRRTRALLERNLDELGLRALARVDSGDVRSAVARLGREGARFELIFADPPYAGGWADRVLESGLEDLLSEGGCLIVERSARGTPAEAVGAFRLRESRTYGQTRFDWYERMESVTS